MRRIVVAAILAVFPIPTAAVAHGEKYSKGCKTKTCMKRVCKAKCQERLALKRRAARPFSTATASWYGPGLYGNKLGCGGRLYPGTAGVAHKTLPCGTRIRICARACTVTRVIDRGPYVAGREFDLTAPVRSAIGAGSVGPVRWQLY